MSHYELVRRRANAAVVRAVVAVIARKQIKVTDLSVMSGIPRSTLHNKFACRSELTVAELVQLAVALEIPVLDLLTIATDVTTAAHEPPEETQA